ncbi:hypothetical protein ABIB48_002469 [Arthrobacter sp. UYCu511]|uniref:hypothetical protein n=1 Tax=Arthrobacter sp. UYCu511 TaxID=3156337 RepID=UPI00339291D0
MNASSSAAQPGPVAPSGTASSGTAPSGAGDARQRRKKLLLWSAPAILVAAVVALKLLSLPLAAGQAGAAYGSSNADGTVHAGQAMGVLNLVERYKSHFAVGDGYVLRGDFERARKEFATALELVPAKESCKVRVNLVLSLEKLGEEGQKAGDTARALEFFAQGSATVEQAPRDCFTPDSANNSDGEGDALRDAAQRLEEKASASQDGGQDGEGGESEPGQDTPAPPASKLDKLKESGQKAQQERSKGQKLDELLEEEPEQHPKPW